MNNKIYSMMGLAQKAGELVSGDDVCEMTIRSKKGLLVIIACDASDRTKKKYINMSISKNIKYLEYGLKDQIGNCIGKGTRSVIVIKNISFAKKLEELIIQSGEVNGGGTID